MKFDRDTMHLQQRLKEVWQTRLVAFALPVGRVTIPVFLNIDVMSEEEAFLTDAKA